MAVQGVLKTLQLNNMGIKNDNSATPSEGTASELDDFDMTEGPTAEECSPYEETVDTLLNQRVETVPGMVPVSSTAPVSKKISAPSVSIVTDPKVETKDELKKASPKKPKMAVLTENLAKELKQDLGQETRSGTSVTPQERDRSHVGVEKNSSSGSELDLDTRKTNQPVITKDTTVVRGINHRKTDLMNPPPSADYSEWATSVTKGFNATKKRGSASASKIPKISKRVLTMPPIADDVGGSCTPPLQKSKKDLKRDIHVSSSAEQNLRVSKKPKKSESRIETKSLDQGFKYATFSQNQNSNSETETDRAERVPKSKTCYRKWKSVGLMIMGAVLASACSSLYESFGSCI